MPNFIGSIINMEFSDIIFQCEINGVISIASNVGAILIGQI